MTRWLIDTDILIEGERGNAGFAGWFQSEAESFATCDIVRGEFLFGVHSVPDAVLRERGLRFYRDIIVNITSLANEPTDYAKAASLAGDARRHAKGNPGIIDGLIAAVALRTGAKVATRNTRDFTAMGCECANPLLAKT